MGWEKSDFQLNGAGLLEQGAGLELKMPRTACTVGQSPESPGQGPYKSDAEGKP